MPTYRSINIALHSQFDIETIPEYYPPSPDSLNTSSPIAPLIDDATSTCSVYIPALPGSQFWIAYSVSPPVPEGHYFLFKLSIDGEPVVSWSTGKDDAWRGKTMFGLFDAGNGKTVEKRMLCFSAPDKMGGIRDGVVEIRVHRASGRRRVEREIQSYEMMGHAQRESGISLVNAGRAGPELPKRFYRFRLIDPVDQPFATFRYYYRSWEQLRYLGLLDVERYPESEGDELSVIEPGDMNTPSRPGGSILSFHGDSIKSDVETVKIVDKESNDVSKSGNDSISVRDHHPEDSNTHTMSSGTYIPRGAPSSTSTGSPQLLRRRGRLNTYRLSMPPSIRFDAPDSAPRALPLPQKSSLTSPTAYRPHPAYPVEEWTVRTPSPARSASDGVATLPLAQSRGLGITGTGLIGVISSTWKRTVSSAQATKETEDSTALRSVSC